MSPAFDAAVVGLATGLGLATAAVLAERGARRSVAADGRSRLLGSRRDGAPVARWMATRWAAARSAAIASPPARSWRERRDARRREEQLPDLVDAVVRSVRAGASLPTALRDGAELVGGPLLDDLVAVERDVELGVPWSAALAGWAARSGDDVRLLVTAAGLGAEMGRGTAAALDGVATTLADRRDVAGEARAAAAQATASAAMLVLLPVLFAGVLAAVDPTSLATLVGTPLGLLCLAVAIGLDVVGAWWMRRLIGSVV